MDEVVYIEYLTYCHKSVRLGQSVDSLSQQSNVTHILIIIQTFTSSTLQNNAKRNTFALFALIAASLF